MAWFHTPVAVTTVTRRIWAGFVQVSVVGATFSWHRCLGESAKMAMERQSKLPKYLWTFNRWFRNQGRSSDNFENLDFRSCLMIDLGRETDGNNEICLGVRFALCIIKVLRLARIKHCFGTVVTRILLHSLWNFNRRVRLGCTVTWQIDKTWNARLYWQYTMAQHI